MTITVTQITEIRGFRVERTASATVDRQRGAMGVLQDFHDREGAERRYREQLTNTSRALFDALGEE